MLMRQFIRFNSIIGQGGVYHTESRLARKCGFYFKTAKIFVLFGLLFQWYMEVHDLISVKEAFISNLSVLTFFIIEALVLWLLVDNKMRYLIRNWATLIIIGFGLAVVIFSGKPETNLVENLRLVLIIWLFLPWVGICYVNLSDNRLGTTLVTAFFIMVFAGVLISGIDPNIKTPWEGIWWAWVTVSTVGYGDIVPLSTIGRIFAAVLILMGLLLFSVITANLSYIFVERGVRKEISAIREDGERIRNILQGLSKVQREERDIIEILHNLEGRLEKLEKLRKKSNSKKT